MNLRCSFCQTPFTIGRVEKLDALQHMDSNKLNHYDAHCPRCRRATPVLRSRLEMTMPNWREALKELEKEMKANPQQEAPARQPEPESVVEAETRPSQHRTRAGKAAKEEEKPTAKAAPAKKPATRKTATKKKTSAKKSK